MAKLTVTMKSGTTYAVEMADGFGITAPFNDSYYAIDMYGMGWGFNWREVEFIKLYPTTVAT